MERTERFYKIEKLLRQHKTVGFAAYSVSFDDQSCPSGKQYSRPLA